MRIPTRRPSPALLIGIVALLVALGGTATAAHLINGRSIRKNSIPGDRIKRKSLTERQIRLNSFGAVPRARRADSAGSAISAGSVNGYVPQKLFARQPRGTGQQLLLNAGPVQIYSGCSSTGVVSLRAVPIAPAARAQVGVITGANTSRGRDYAVLNPGGNADLDQNQANGEGTATFLGANGSLTTATYTFGGGSSGCIVAGTVLTHG